MRLIFVFLLLPVVVFAQSEPGNIVDTLDSDWNNDGIPDRAILSIKFDEKATNPPSFGEGLADLLIFLGNSGADGFAEPFISTEFTMHDVPNGITASLQLDDEGNLKVVSINETDDIPRFNTATTLAYQNEEFILARYKLGIFGENGSGDCEISFLTGIGLLTIDDGRTFPVEITPDTKAMSEWDAGDAPIIECFMNEPSDY